jgi:flagellar biosynthetic protein FliP
MLQQSLTILSALAFVLSLVWAAVWFAKRQGIISARPRARVAMEVVQRISLGPKAGLAVVRVGEKVMAVSMGPEGLRPLFELEEADRQRIIASSETPLPLPSSAEAERAMLSMTHDTKIAAVPSAVMSAMPFTLPSPVASAVSSTMAPESIAAAPAVVAAPAMERVVTNVLPKSMKYVLPTAVANMFQRETFVPAVSFAGAMQSALNNNKTTAGNALPEQMSAGERDFRNVLNMTLSTATRLAVFGGVALLSVMSASNTALAQVNPPANPPAAVTTAPTTPTTTQATTQTAAPVTGANAALQAPAAPTVSVPQAPTAPQGAATRTARPASVRGATVQSPGSISQNNYQGNAQANAGATQRQPKTPEQIARERNSRDSINASLNARNQTRTLPGSETRGLNRTPPAQSAPIAGGEEALAKMLPQMDLKMGDAQDGGLRLSGTVGIVVMMGLLTLLPTLVLMMTGFTRILIVLQFLKQAMGTQSAPPGQLLAAMALLLTGFVMAPTLMEVNRTALEPWMNGQMTQVEMLKEGVKPMRTFMIKQMKDKKDLRTFIELSNLPQPETIDDVPLHVITSSFVASELRKAFQIGFMIYLPFIIIDAVVASVLMSMGMFMLPPAMISMPFKLLLFVLVDGWGLVIQSLVKSFNQ